MLEINRRDALAILECKKAIDNCKRYFIQPAPYFPLAVRMYEELERQGLLTLVEDKRWDYKWREKDLCDGCANEIGGGICRLAYRSAVLSEGGTRVRYCADWVKRKGDDPSVGGADRSFSAREA